MNFQDDSSSNGRTSGVSADGKDIKKEKRKRKISRTSVVLGSVTSVVGKAARVMCFKSQNVSSASYGEESYGAPVTEQASWHPGSSKFEDPFPDLPVSQSVPSKPDFIALQLSFYELSFVIY